MPYKDPVKQKESATKRYKKNREQRIEYEKERREVLKQHAYNSITIGEIIDQNKWDMWCNEIKRCAQKNTQPYSDDFTNEIIFDMMINRCFYCGDIATTIDRVDSKLEHKPDNCVGSCHGCNNSKGSADPFTFIRKAYYRTRERYYDDDIDIWFVNKRKPSMFQYKKSAEKRKVPFELTKDDFDTLIKGKCEYCHRAPNTWFGIDRIMPSLGYVLKNVVTCCWDCNLDKHEVSIETMMRRNERIVQRVDDGVLVINVSDKDHLHNGAYKLAKKVSVYGKVYVSMSDASRSIGKGISYVCQCIRDGTHSKYIFEIHDDFQSAVK